MSEGMKDQIAGAGAPLESTKLAQRKLGRILGGCLCLLFPFLALMAAGEGGTGFIGELWGAIFGLISAILYPIWIVVRTLFFGAGWLVSFAGILPYFAVCFYLLKRALTRSGFIPGSRWADFACATAATLSMTYLSTMISESDLDYVSRGSGIHWPHTFLCVITGALTGLLILLYRAEGEDVKAGKIKTFRLTLFATGIVVLLMSLSTFTAMNGTVGVDDEKLIEAAQVIDKNDPAFPAALATLKESVKQDSEQYRIFRLALLDTDSLKEAKARRHFTSTYWLGKNALSCLIVDGKVQNAAMEYGFLSDLSEVLAYRACAIKALKPASEISN